MTVLIDPPVWPAHGRLWSHLVSDTSLHELRTFARAAGIPDRAFDVDHYDVPADRYGDLLAVGAVPVDGGALSRRLAASGLRVPGRERGRAKRPALRRRWAALWAGSEDALGADDGAAAAPVAAVGEDLIERWGEPHRVYHSRLHLADTLDALDLLLSAHSPELSERRTGIATPRSDNSGEGWLAALALWFHDAVHDGATPDDEERSAALARTLLTPLVSCQSLVRVYAYETLTTHQVEEVARLVLVTAGHDPDPDDHAASLVSDADLAILGSPPARYARYVSQVRAEYGHVTDGDFRAGRAAVVEQLLALHRTRGLYRTVAARHRWADRAEANLRAELAGLRA